VPEPLQRPVPISPPPPAVPAPAPPPQLVRVTFAGPVGATAYLDGVALGETNVSYEVAVGEHTCGVGYGAPAESMPCIVTPQSRAVRLPAVAPP
jgi:hypothetical protein